jgi:hypothetical protein
LLSLCEADQCEYCDYRIDYAFHVLGSLHCFFFGISGVELAKTVPEQDIRGGIWLIGWLCERAFRSRLTLREEGQVALLESPNELGATAEFQLRGEVSRTEFPAN